MKQLSIYALALAVIQDRHPDDELVILLTGRPREERPLVGVRRVRHPRSKELQEAHEEHRTPLPAALSDEGRCKRRAFLPPLSPEYRGEGRKRSLDPARGTLPGKKCTRPPNRVPLAFGPIRATASGAFLTVLDGERSDGNSSNFHWPLRWARG